MKLSHLSIIAVGMLLVAGCVTVPQEVWDLIPDKPAVSTTTTTTTTTLPPAPVEEPKEEPSSSPNAESLHGPVWSTEGATQINRESGQVNNPANSRGKLKFIASGKRSGTIVRVYCFKGSFKDTLKRQTPNESSNRQRYYGTKAPGEYPKDLIIRMDINDGGQARDVYYVLQDPAKREG